MTDFLMKRKVTVSIIVVVCFLLQSTLFKALSIASISPNLLVIVTSAFGFMRGKKEGLLVGFFSGLSIDLFSSGAVGISSAICWYIFFSSSFAGNLRFPTIWCILSCRSWYTRS